MSWALQGGAGPQLWEMSAEMSGIWERVRAVGASLTVLNDWYVLYCNNNICLGFKAAC